MKLFHISVYYMLYVADVQHPLFQSNAGLH